MLAERASALPLAQPQRDGPTFGTAHPLGSMTVDPGARWVAFCQARKDTNGDGRVEASWGHHGEVIGDRMAAYLAFSGGEGQPIDAFAAAAPTGDYVSFVRGGRLVLASSDGVPITFGAGMRPGFKVQRPAGWSETFDSTGKRFLYLARKNRHEVLRLRELEATREIEIDPGPGMVDSVRFDPSGHWLVIGAYTRDDNRDGTIGSTANHPTPGDACNGFPGMKNLVVRSDAPETRVARIGTDKVARVVAFALS